MRFVFYGLLSSFLFPLGMWYEKHYYGYVDIFTNVDHGTPMNHGQKSMQIHLPSGMELNSFGSCEPNWVIYDPDVKPTYNSFSIEVEKFTENGSAPYNPFNMGDTTQMYSTSPNFSVQ